VLGLKCQPSTLVTLAQKQPWSAILPTFEHPSDASIKPKGRSPIGKNTPVVVPPIPGGWLHQPHIPLYSVLIGKCPQGHI
jgi:hypothetical protein